MAKQCIYCGQPLAKDDARFCNNCGRTQPASSAAAAEPSPIKVKLPPKEIVRDEALPPPVPPIPGRIAGSVRPPQREQAAQPASRLPKRPARLTSTEASAQGELPEKKAQPEIAHPSEATLAKTAAEESTMVLPGWQEELALLRKEREGAPAQAEKKPSVSAASPAPEVAPRRLESEPREKSAPIPASAPEMISWRSQSEKPTPAAEATSRRPQNIPAHLQQLASSLPEEQGSERTVPLEQPLHVNVWEQEPKAQLPKAPTPKSAPEAGPAPAVAQAPFSALSFDSVEQAETLTELNTEIWQDMNKPVPPKSAAQPGSEKPALPGQRVQPIEDEYATQLSVEEPDKLGVEDLPTQALAVPEFVKGQPQLKIERTSTPRNGSAARNEVVEDQPTRPMQMSAIAPRSPQPSVAEQPQARLMDLPPLENRSGPAQRPGNPVSFPGAYAQASGFDGPGRSPNPHSQPGNNFNPSVMSPLPHQQGNPGQQSNIQREWQAQSQRSSLPETPSTPRPNSATLEKPRQKKRSGRLFVILLLVLVLGGLVAYIVAYQPFTNSLAQADQTYQSTTLGVSLHYPQGWTVSSSQNGVHFADSSATGQVNLSSASANGSTLDQYVSQQVKQLGITSQKAGPAISFGGASWQQVQGSVIQNGATYSITLYVTQHNGHFYALACLTLPNVYANMEHDDFAPLRASFQFV